MGHLNLPSGSNSFHGELKNTIKPSMGALACMINSEIGAVLAVMRRNVRWGVRYMADDDQLEHYLIHSLKELRKKIFSWQKNWHGVDPALYLQPFLDVIQSDETGAPITGVALSSVYKILTLDVLNLDTVNVGEAMHLIVDAVKSCRFEVTDPASEEVVLMKILQVLLASMKCKAATRLSNHGVCNIVNTCLRVVQQSSSKSELLQRIARHTMHELVRCIFSRLPDFDSSEHSPANGSVSRVGEPVGTVDWDHSRGDKQVENGNFGIKFDVQATAQNASSPTLDIPETTVKNDEKKTEVSDVMDAVENGQNITIELSGIPCMMEIFHFLCSLLNVGEGSALGPRSNPVAFDEDVPLFALGLINSAIELGGSSFRNHPKLLGLIQDELFYNLMQFGLSPSPLVLSTVCSIVLNLYLSLRTELKVQLEAFFSCVLLRIAQSKHGSSYQQQEVAMEALVDLCRHHAFMSEMFANFDCDMTCGNLFEDLANLLSKSAFPVNGPLSTMHILALDGLISMVQGMAERVSEELLASDESSSGHEEYEAFWTMKCEDYQNPDFWIPFVRKAKNIKRRLMVGADRFNREPKKGLEILQEMHLLPDKLDPNSVASFFRYTSGLDKNVIGDFLGNHDQFCVQVLHEFTKTFDFSNMNLDTALRLFVGTFRLPGESQKIQRVLEAFAERYYEQSPQILMNKDAALLLSYSLIMLNTDQHNVQVKKKMTTEDFIRNNRRINGGEDLPRDFLTELYNSICENEIQMIPDQGTSYSAMTVSRWISVIHKSKEISPYIICDSSTSLLDLDMFAILSGPTMAAMSVVFDQAEQEEVLQRCVDGFLAVAKISAFYHFDRVLDDLVMALCKFTSLLNPISVDEAVLALVEDARARLATTAVFLIANKYGDYMQSGWKNILDCVLNLQKLGLLPASLASDSADDMEPSSDNPELGKTSTSSLSVVQAQSSATPRKPSGLIGRFSQLLSLDMEETQPEPSEEELAAHKHAREIVKECHIDTIFTESKFLQAKSLLQLVRALITIAERDEEHAVFCLELLIAITLNNRDRILLMWQSVYEHVSNIVKTNSAPCMLVEKAVFGLLKICQRLLPYKEGLTDELLKSLQLILKLDARVADAYCEPITQEVSRLVKANATHIRSLMGWRTIISLLSITARHPEASEAGFEALVFIMSDGAHLLPCNYALCLDAARQFAESRVGEIERSILAVDLMANSVSCLSRWSFEAKNAMGEEEAAMKLSQDIGEMWIRLVSGLKRLCLDQRDEVRHHAILMLQRSLGGANGFQSQPALWFQLFDSFIFSLLDELLKISQENSKRNLKKTEETLVLITKLMSKAFLQSLQDVSQQPSFCRLWIGVLNRFENFMKVKFRGKRSNKIHELIPELLKNTLLVMKTTGILFPGDDIGSDSFWQLTWLHVEKICPSLQSEVFSEHELENLRGQTRSSGQNPTVLVSSSETAA